MTLILLGTFCLSSLTQGMHGGMVNPLDEPEIYRPLENVDEVSIWNECVVVDHYLEYLQTNIWLISEKIHERRKKLVAELQKRVKEFQAMMDAAIADCRSEKSQKTFESRSESLRLAQKRYSKILEDLHEEASEQGVRINYTVT